MLAAPQRVVRWSKRTDELVRYLALYCPPRLQSELGGWIEAMARFATFVSANQTRSARNSPAQRTRKHALDARAELLVACLLLTDRRFAVAFEAYGAYQAAPDLTATYRIQQRFNLELARWRG